MKLRVMIVKNPHSLYKREVKNIELASGERVKAYVYYQTKQPTAISKYFPDGDWLSK